MRRNMTDMALGNYAPLQDNVMSSLATALDVWKEVVTLLVTE